MADFLAHPIVVLLFGAVLTGLIIPTVTRRWQDRQKTLELKTDLVSEISQSVMEMVMTVQFVHLGARSLDQQQFDEAYREWEIESAVIGTKLRAYFPETTIPAEWSDLSQIVTEFYALEGVPEAQRPGQFLATSEKLSALLGPSRERARDWGALKEGILEKRADLVQKILRSKIPVLGAG